MLSSGHGPDGRAARAPGKDEIHAVQSGRPDQAVLLPVEKCIDVSINSAVVIPDNVELAVVRVYHLVEQHKRHARQQGL